MKKIYLFCLLTNLISCKSELEVFYQAIADNKLETVRQLINRGVAIRAHINYTSEVLSSSSIFFDNKNLYEFANMSVLNFKFRNLSPLEQAAKFNSLEVAEHLINRGATVSFEDYNPLSQAIYSNALNVANLLINNGADISQSILDIIAWRWHILQDPHLETIKNLKIDLANIYWQDDGRSLFYFLCQHGDLKLIKKIIKLYNKIGTILISNKPDAKTALEYTKEKYPQIYEILKKEQARRRITEVIKTAKPTLESLVVNDVKNIIISYLLLPAD